jgi:two-component system LytT family response regulator
MVELRCILADDEPLALELLESLVGSIPGVSVAASCRDGIEALDAIRSEQPDLAFLDIEMPGLSGFDIIRSLQPETMPAIVFTTAFNQYAIDAFEVHAVDYVLKPLSGERLALAVERARVRIQGERRHLGGDKGAIMNMIGQLTDADQKAESDATKEADSAQARGETRRLLVRDSGKTHVIDQASIDWVDAAGDYMCIHAGADTQVMRITMKNLLDQLDEGRFARIHRSTLVNVARVERIENLGKGDCILYLADGNSLKASRNYREQLMTLLA